MTNDLGSTIRQMQDDLKQGRSVQFAIVVLQEICEQLRSKPDPTALQHVAAHLDWLSAQLAAHERAAAKKNRPLAWAGDVLRRVGHRLGL